MPSSGLGGWEGQLSSADDEYETGHNGCQPEAMAPARN